MSPEAILEPLQVPLNAAIICSRLLGARMLEQGRGHIVNIVSPAAYFNLPYMAPYGAARSGLLGFSRSLGEELKDRGVQVSSLCPTWVDTDYLANNGTNKDWLPVIARYFPRQSAEHVAARVVLTRFVPFKRLRYRLLDNFYRIIHFLLDTVIHSNNSRAPDQLIRYPERKGISKYTFSIWAFPEEQIMATMWAFYNFSQDYYRQHGFRCDLLNVGYRIQADQNPLFSYSYQGTVMTLDPVATGAEGWNDFLRAYNEFCSEHHGVPLFNQSKWLTREQVCKAFGDRIETFWRYKQRFDPQGRLINAYFSGLLKPD